MHEAVFQEAPGHHLRMNLLRMNVQTSEGQVSMTCKDARMLVWGGKTAQHLTTILQPQAAFSEDANLLL